MGAVKYRQPQRMPAKFPSMSRRTRLKLCAGSAVLSLALWLTLLVAEGYAPLHAWLHGGNIPDKDDCAIVMILHGKVDTSVVVVCVSELPDVVMREGLAPAPIFSPVDYSLLPTRGPPAAFS